MGEARLGMVQSGKRIISIDQSEADLRYLGIDTEEKKGRETGS